MSKTAERIMKVEEYKELISAVFRVKGGSLNHCLNHIRINVFPHNRKVTCVFEDNDVGISEMGVSVCHPNDVWDEYTGVLVALVRLKISLVATLNKALKKCLYKQKVWVPKIGETYYECYFNDKGSILVDKSVWEDSDYDFVQLSDNNVFRTEREARKHGRRSMFNGRKIAKEVRRG